MNKTRLLIRAAAIRALSLLDPPKHVRHRAAFSATGLAMAAAAVDAGPHGSHRRPH